MSSNESKVAPAVEGILVSFIFSCVGYIVCCFITHTLSVIYLGHDVYISSSVIWNIVLANAMLVFFGLIFIPMDFKWKVIGLSLFFALSGYLGTYKISTSQYYMSYGSYLKPELYPENSNQRKVVTDIVANKNMEFMGKYDSTYFVKADIDKLGNMTNFFMTYGQRNEQMKTYEARFKELLNGPFFTAWDYKQFENEVINYLISSESSLQRSESVSMVHTIKFGV